MKECPQAMCAKRTIQHETQKEHPRTTSEINKRDTMSGVKSHSLKSQKKKDDL